MAKIKCLVFLRNRQYSMRFEAGISNPKLAERDGSALYFAIFADS